MKINKYPDGTSYVDNVDIKPTPFRVNNYVDLWHLNQYVDAFISKYGFKPNIFIPNLLDAQADRRFNKGESFGLKLVLEFLRNLPVKEYYIFHPHNPEVVEMMLDNVTIIDNTEFIKDVLNRIDYSTNGEDCVNHLIDSLVLMSSDAGGFKPLMKLCDKINWQGETASANKSRSYVNGETKLVQGLDRQDFGGKDILIVDDISVYGGTFKGLSKLLKEANCGKLYLAVSHMTVQDLNRDPVTNYFDKVFTTNSKFDKYFYYTDYEICKDPEDYREPENLEIIKTLSCEH